MSTTDRATARATGAAAGPGARSTVQIVPLGEDHHDWVARLHVAELPHGLFPRLGHRFVAQWHRAHVASPYGAGYVALLDGAPVGFALGCHDRSANVAWILAHRRGRLARSGAVALALRPRVAVDFLRTRAGRYARRLVGRPARRPPVPTSTASSTASATPAAPQPAQGPVAVLEAIVVLPGIRTRGVGSQLVDLFLAETAESGAAYVELVTKDGDQGAAGFYRKRGWQQVSSHDDRDGDTVLRFRTVPGPRAE